jgi:chromosome segregation ATPase
MSEPARSFATYEDESQAAPGPLRDWLSAMRHHSVAMPEPAEPLRDSELSWGPRLVEAAPAPQEDSSDISELMAENLMLKARLKVEADRQDALQSALADQIRELRAHIAEEMRSLEELQAEQVAAKAEYDEFRLEREQIRRDRDALRGERDRLATERDALQAEREATIAERDMAREERDLWRARAEALAQPLFQPAKR